MAATTPRSFRNGLKVHLVPEGTYVHRIHRLTDGVIFFGPATGNPPVYRFDAPAAEYRIIYCAQNVTGAFMETILRDGRTLLRPSFIEARANTLLRVGRELRLAKLYGDGLAWHGVNADVTTGGVYDEPRLLARDLFLTFPDCDGVAYLARHDNAEICYALFDRVMVSDLQPVDRREFRNEMRVAEAIMREHGSAFDSSTPVVNLSAPVV